MSSEGSEEVGSESIDLDEVIANKTWWEKVAPFFYALSSVLLGLWRMLISRVSHFSERGIVYDRSHKVQVFYQGSPCTLFLPRTFRSTPEGDQRLVSRGKIESVTIISEKEEITWTKEFLKLSGPQQNFFGLPVSLRAIRDAEPGTSDIRIIMNVNGVLEKVVFKEWDYITIYEYRNVN